MVQPMPKLIDALSARIHFGELMSEVEKRKSRFLVSKRGKPKVVILSVEDFLKNIVKQPELLTSIQVSAKKTGLDQMSDKEINEEVSFYRKKNK